MRLKEYCVLAINIYLYFAGFFSHLGANAFPLWPQTFCRSLKNLCDLGTGHRVPDGEGSLRIIDSAHL